MIIRLAPRIGSAEPTGMSEVFRWIRPFTHESLQALQETNHGFSYASHFIGCCAGLFLLYGIMMMLAKGARSLWFMAIAWASSTAFMGMLLCAPAMLSTDTYAYSFFGRLLACYGLDAHAAAPARTLSDPFLSKGWYEFPPSVYGPLWTVISGWLVRLGAGHVGETILLMRSVEAACVLGCGGLIWLIMKRLAPGRAALGTVLFLWNPLVLMESALGGHNDTCMMFLALLALWLHLRGCRAAAAVALVLSALVKVITAALVPLYLLMVLRSSRSWKEAGWFLVRSGLGIAAAVAFSVISARMSLNGLLIHTASSAQFYENNYHELIFKGLRRMLGEPVESINAPMDFGTYWLAITYPTVLREGVSENTAALCPLIANQPLLAISDEDSDNWMRVYDPADRKEGYVDWAHLYVMSYDPPVATTDPIVKQISGWPPEWPTVKKANQIIRVGTWSLFVMFGLLAAWKTTDFDRFIWWSTAFFLASQLLVFTKIWPWYFVWPLAYGAVIPGRAVTRLAILLSAGSSILYVLFDFAATRRDWINQYRSVPTIVLPVLVFCLLEVCIALRARRAKDRPAAAAISE